MTAMYDGIDTRVPVLCLGCVPGVLDLPHQCAGERELMPYGGQCQCPRCRRDGASHANLTARKRQ